MVKESSLKKTSEKNEKGESKKSKEVEKDESLEEEIEENEEVGEEEQLEDFERFMSEGRIVEIAPKSSVVLQTDAPVENLEDLRGVDEGGRRETNENGNLIQYVSPSGEDEIKKYIMSEERKMRPKVELRDDFELGAVEISRADDIVRIAPEKTFLKRELENTGFKGDYDIEKDYIPGQGDAPQIKRKRPWQR